MPKIAFLNEDLTVTIQAGATIMDAAKEAGINLFEGSFYNCDGKGRCLGKGCRVWVLTDDIAAVSPPAFWERIRPKIVGQKRLACMTHVLADLEVRTQPGALRESLPNMVWDPDPAPSRWRQRLSESPKPKKAVAKPAAAAAPAAAQDAASDDTESAAGE